MKAQLPATAAQRTCRAFTLLELLVSLAVLGLIILLVTQMLGPASAISGTGNKGHTRPDSSGFRADVETN